MRAADHASIDVIHREDFMLVAFVHRPNDDYGESANWTLERLGEVVTTSPNLSAQSRQFDRQCT